MHSAVPKPLRTFGHVHSSLHACRCPKTVRTFGRHASALVEVIVDQFGNLFGNAVDFLRSSMAARLTALAVREMQKQGALRPGPMPLISSSGLLTISFFRRAGANRWRSGGLRRAGAGRITAPDREPAVKTKSMP